jgi:hypothetical protein
MSHASSRCLFYNTGIAARLAGIINMRQWPECGRAIYGLFSLFALKQSSELA